MMDLGKVRVEDVFGGFLDARVSRRGGGSSTRVLVQAPGYRDRVVNLDFSPDTVDLVVMTMKASEAGPNNLSSLCLRNLETAMLNAYLRDVPVGEYMKELQMVHQDRAWFDCLPALKDALEESPQWDDAPGILHASPDGGWQRDSSYKLKREDPILQATLHIRTVQCPMCGGRGVIIYPDNPELLVADAAVDPEATIETHEEPCSRCNGRSVVTEWMAEMDLDLKSGVGHWFEVLGNFLTTDKTNPHEVAQALYVGWGLESYIPTAGGHDDVDPATA